MSYWALKYHPGNDADPAYVQFDDVRFNVCWFNEPNYGYVYEVEVQTNPCSIFTDYDLSGLCYNMNQLGFPNCRVEWPVFDFPWCSQYILYTSFDIPTQKPKEYFEINRIRTDADGHDQEVAVTEKRYKIKPER
jgi:hypothetical protein